MATKKEITLEERFMMNATTPTAGKTVYNKLVKANVKDFTKLSLEQILAIPGMGRQAARLVMEVACDLAGKK